MRMPKVNWTTVGSFVCLFVGFIFEELQRIQDNAETKQELKTYVDNKMAGVNVDEENE